MQQQLSLASEEEEKGTYDRLGGGFRASHFDTMETWVKTRRGCGGFWCRKKALSDESIQRMMRKWTVLLERSRKLLIRTCTTSQAKKK